MTRRQRGWHRGVWIALALVIPVVVVAAVRARPAPLEPVSSPAGAP